MKISKNILVISLSILSTSTVCPSFVSCSIKFDAPKLNIFGSLTDLHSKDDKAKVKISYVAPDHKYDFEADATIKWQGNSSLGWPKKNFNIELFDKNTDYKETKKLQVCDSWGKYSKYTLKANYNDVLMSHNIVSSQLYGDLIHSEEIDDDLSPLLNGGATDGFPIALYNNDKFIGMYCLNMKKDKYLYNLEKEDTRKSAMFFSNIYEPEGSNTFERLISDEDINLGKWEIEFCSKQWNDDAVISKFNEFINFVLTSDDTNFKSSIGNYVHLDRLIDYFLFVDSGLMLDNTTNNIMWTTFDGEKWYPGFYDADCSWGYDSFVGYREPNTDTNLERCKLFKRLKDNFGDELRSRYALLKNKILNAKYVINKFQKFNDSIDKKLFDADKKCWPDALYRNLNDMGHLNKFIIERFKYIDEKWGS